MSTQTSPSLRRTTQPPPRTQDNTSVTQNPKTTNNNQPPRDRVPLAPVNTNLKWNTCHMCSKPSHFARDCPKRALVMTEESNEKESKKDIPSSDVQTRLY